MDDREVEYVDESKYTMLPPEPGIFLNREDLVQYVRDFGASQGYVVTIKKSRKDLRVLLGCDRGGVYRNRRKLEENQRKRKLFSRLIDCPFEVLGKKENDVWVLGIKNGEHNHEPLKDMTEHPCNRRFSEDEVRRIRAMTEAGVKPRHVLKILRESNPSLLSTPRHLYNLKARFRQGNISEKSFRLWRPHRYLHLSPHVATVTSVKKSGHYLKVPNFIAGKFVQSNGSSLVGVTNPATQEVVSYVPISSFEEFRFAVSAAKSAFPSWKTTPVAHRQCIIYKFQELVRRDLDKIAACITIEQGKTLKGAQNDLLQALETVQHACGMATVQMGEFVPISSNGVETYSIREPLGVCAGICPFDFPATTPLWMFPVSIMCGNTFVLKPCTHNPGVSMLFAALAMEAGLPGGVLNIVHGTNEIINYMCDDDDVKAISFVASDPIGMQISASAAAKGKRVQSNIGGKNHAIIMPDASMSDTLDALVASSFGAAGQRSMSLSSAVFVGDSLAWKYELVERAMSLKVNVGTDPCVDVGPVIRKEVKTHIHKLVDKAIESGAKLLLDGRNILVPSYEIGNFVAPTILCDVTTSMDCYKEELFGPVLLCMQAETLEEAIQVINSNRFGHGASIFTSSGVAAWKFQNDIETGLVGINVPVPISLPLSLLNGSKEYGVVDLGSCGKSTVQFYTQTKTVSQQWRDMPGTGLGISLSIFTPLEIETSHGVASDLPQENDSPLPAMREVSPNPSPVLSDSEQLQCHQGSLEQEDFTDPAGISAVCPIAQRGSPSLETADMYITPMPNCNNAISLTSAIDYASYQREYMPTLMLAGTGTVTGTGAGRSSSNWSYISESEQNCSVPPLISPIGNNMGTETMAFLASDRRFDLAMGYGNGHVSYTPQ